MYDDFIRQQTYTDGALRVETGIYPDDRAPSVEVVRVLEVQTDRLVAEVRRASLTQPPYFDRPGVVTLTFTGDGTTRTPVIIDSRSNTCAFHPMHEEPLSDLNTRLSSFWKTPVPPPSPPVRSDEWSTRLAAMLFLIAFGGLALYAVFAWSLSSMAFRIVYVLGFLGMITTMLLFVTRHSR